MPIYFKESQKEPASAGSFATDDKKLKQLLVVMHQQVKSLTTALRQLKSEKRALEQKLTQKDYDIKQLKHELDQLKRGSKRVGNVEFGD